jgi:hypothetical protein
MVLLLYYTLKERGTVVLLGPAAKPGASVHILTQFTSALVRPFGLSNLGQEREGLHQLEARLEGEVSWKLAK